MYTLRSETFHSFSQHRGVGKEVVQSRSREIPERSRSHHGRSRRGRVRHEVGVVTETPGTKGGEPREKVVNRTV